MEQFGFWSTCNVRWYCFFWRKMDTFLFLYIRLHASPYDNWKLLSKNQIQNHIRPFKIIIINNYSSFINLNLYAQSVCVSCCKCDSCVARYTPYKRDMFTYVSIMWVCVVITNENHAFVRWYWAASPFLMKINFIFTHKTNVI